MKAEFRKSRGPNKDRGKIYRRINLFLVGLSVVCACIILVQYLTMEGYIGIWTYGIGYISRDYNHYTYESNLLQEDVEFEVDFSDWETYRNLTIFQSGDLSLELENIDETNGRYRIFFKEHGIYSRESAALISWREYGYDASQGGKRWGTVTLFCDDQGESTVCKFAGDGSMDRDGDRFGFHVPETITADSQTGVVKFRLHDLSMNQWCRKTS